MRRQRRRILTAGLGLASALVAGSSAGILRAAAPETLAIVVAKGSRIHVLSLHELRRLYLGEHVEGPNGERLIPLNQARNAPERAIFDRKVLGMDPDEVGRYWIDRKIRGQSGPPKAISPAERLRAAIKHVDGTLTYVRAGEVGDGMKVVAIDGKTPGQSGYPLLY